VLKVADVFIGPYIGLSTLKYTKISEKELLQIIGES
jgi:hypothetical protein